MHQNRQKCELMRTLEDKTVNQYILHKHHLSDGSQALDVLQVVNDIIALHATSVGTPYISLFARTKNFQRSDLDQEFYRKRNLVRLRAMRGTLFIASSDLAPVLFQATKLPEHHLLSLTQRWGISSSEYCELSEKLCSILKGGGKTLPQIRKALPRGIVRTIELREGKSAYKWTNVKWVLSVMTRSGTVMSEKDAGSLRITKANRYVLFREIYPKLYFDSVSRQEARAMLVERYIKAFGPVTEEDIAWWTGFKKADLKEALETIEKKLLPMKISGSDREYLMSESDFKQLVKFKPLTTSSALLLPYEDPFTKGYKLRERLVEKEHDKKVYVGGGVQPTILLDGKIVGIWNRNVEQGKGPTRLLLFQKLGKNMEKAIIQKAKAIGKLMTNRDTSVEIVQSNV